MNQQLTLAPVARLSDPSTSHEAAKVMRGGNDACVAAIRAVLREHYALTAFQIVEEVERLHPGRWDEGGIRTACSRAGLEQRDRGEKHRTRSGRLMSVVSYMLPYSDGERTVRVTNGAL